MSRPLQVYLDDAEWEGLERWARARGWTRSQAVRAAELRGPILRSLSPLRMQQEVNDKAGSNAPQPKAAVRCPW